MTRTVTLDEAQRNLEEMLQWAKENNEGVIVEQSGKPEGVLVSYDEYTELDRVRKQEAKRKAQAAIEAISREAAARNQDLTAEEAYRLAGFSEDVICETIEYDRKLAQQE
jgi:prevent-host-death family protein